MKKIIFWGVACFQIVMVSILIHFLPSEVPIHFNLIGEIDRWGSKYELYSIVGVTLICLIPLYLMVHRIEKRTLSFNITQKEKKEIKKQVDIILYCGIGLGILMTFFNIETF